MRRPDLEPQKGPRKLKLNAEQIRLLREPHLAYVATVNRDGSPQVTPVWVDTDGEAILFNTARGRLKCRNLERDPRVSIAVVDAANPDSRTLIARGRAVLIEEGALAHIDLLSRKYDHKQWVAVPGQTRVIVRVLPDRISSAD
jgi:PPOX class probable F420-dependent enzyme